MTTPIDRHEIVSIHINGIPITAPLWRCARLLRSFAAAAQKDPEAGESSGPVQRVGETPVGSGGAGRTPAPATVHGASLSRTH